MTRRRASRGSTRRHNRPDVASEPLRPLDLPTKIADAAIPQHWQTWIPTFRESIQAFQDRWDLPTIEQYVAADFQHVGNVLRHLVQQPIIPTELGGRFLEWGSGFGLITLLAADLGLDAIGIEVEEELVRRGEIVRRELQIAPEQSGQHVIGNFLPDGAHQLSNDATHPSIGHPSIDAYDTLGLDIEDFGIVYSYPWPGENEFHRAVFARYASIGAVYVQFCGPYDVQVWQKRSR